MLLLVSFAIPAVVLGLLGLVLVVVSVVVGLAVIVVGIGAGALVAWRASSRAIPAVLQATRAEPGDASRDARLFNLVENLCIVSGLPAPAVYVVAERAPNAYAIGRDPKEASIAVTSGLVETLERIELEGVLAQLVSQVRADVVAPSTIAVTTAGAMLALPGLGGLGRRLLAYAVDEQRDTRADLAAVGLTRYPPGLIAALERLERSDCTVPGATLATAHLWFVDPGVESVGAEAREPLEERIAALREL